ncbi:death domain-containing protein CRADD-like [Acanthaster planci]|uniref:Death domain-containing protein CRADD-like n=1 Tax=Acanthaster planci TaxID=133434 RepID=A0A8B7YTJ8_ACAPL|nr:death domain-containing protein CRADD-like [Acanthaster planci]
MSSRYADVLDQCRVALVKDLNPDDVMDYLIADRVLVPDDKERVDARSTRREKVRELLDLLARRGDRAFITFMAALKDLDSGHNHLYELLQRKLEDWEHQAEPMRLEQQQQTTLYPVEPRQPVKCTEQNHGDFTDSKQGFCSKPQQSQVPSHDLAEWGRNHPKSPNMIPSEKLLSQLAGNLGQDWEQLGSLLGLKDSDMYRCKVENQFNLWGQINSALLKWKNREYKDATILRLVTALKQCNVGREKYEFLMNA